jgi:hypothetical protein
MSSKATSLTELLDQIEEAADDEDEVSLDSVMDAIGRRSFGPMLVMFGLIILAPLVGDIPGVPTIMAILVLLVASQVLIRRKRLWLPRWMLDRGIASAKLGKAIKFLRKPARFVDHMLRPRLEIFTRGVGIQATAALCIAIAVVMPVMEVVPFSANIAGIALTTLGLALIANDGVLALTASAICMGAIGFVTYSMLT